jgi:hypothetical protein
MMREDDLRTLLAERAANPPEHPVRLAAIRRRATRIRRRRTAAVAGAVAVLAGLAAATPGVLHRSDRPAPPIVPQNRMIDGLPEYLNGGRLIQHAVLSGAGQSGATVIAPPGDVFFAAICVGTLRFTYSINGHRVSFGTCGSGVRVLTWPPSAQAQSLEALGVTPAWPMNIAVEVCCGPGDGRTTMGVYAVLPPQRRPQANLAVRPPDRPADLAPSGTAFTPGLDPNATPESVVLTLNPTQLAVISCTAPGTVTVLVGATAVAGLACTDNNGRTSPPTTLMELMLRHGRQARPGDRVLVTVLAGWFESPGWRVDLAEPR